jgi:putative restriction endonuclease
VAFGDIPNNPLGTSYRNYREMIDAGVHRQNIVGMVGNPRDGTESIVLNGGYRDDRDYGDELVYTGFGGQDPRTKRQVRDQKWVGANEGMRTNMARGLPVRVIRGPRGEPAFSPANGYRYDGLYAVLNADRVPSLDGPLICRFKLVKTDAVRVPATEPPL